MAPSAAFSQQAQLQQHADGMQSEASSAQQACHAQHAQQAQQRSNSEQQVVQQLPLLMQQPGSGAGKKKLEQHLQAQLLEDRSATKAGRRQRPTADAAGLACVGMGVQEEQGRMIQSGPLYQPSAVAPAPVPELFEVGTLGDHFAPPPLRLPSPAPTSLAQSADVLLTFKSPALKGVLVHSDCFAEIAAFAVPVTSTIDQYLESTQFQFHLHFSVA